MQQKGLKKTRSKNIIRNPLTTYKAYIEYHVDTNLLKPLKFISDKKR